ncbi:MAG TPA: clostripain-related cysteine peptidase [Pyrinomonadaceae bacterium]
MADSDLKDWTIMIYLSGDNNLSEDMVGGLIGIKEKISQIPKEIPTDFALVAYFDPGAIDFPPLLIDFTKSGSACEDGTQISLNGVPRNRSKKGFRKSGGIFRNIGASPDSIFKFVEFCVGKHQARNYALILSGHGDGFQKNNFLRDESSQTFVSIQKLGEKLRVLTDKDKNFLKQKFSILGFDSCVMGAIEVAHEFADSVDMIVSSQGLVPNLGWNYGKIVAKIAELVREKASAAESVVKEEAAAAGLVTEKMQAAGMVEENTQAAYYKGQNISLNKKEMADIFAKSFLSHYKDYTLYGGRSVDISYNDLRKKEEFDEGETIPDFVFDDAVAGLKSLATNLTLALQTPLIDEKIEKAILNSHAQAQTYVFDQCIDLKDFCELLKRECDLILEENVLFAAVLRDIVKSGIKQTGANDDNDAEDSADKLINSSEVFKALTEPLKLVDAISGDCEKIINAISACAKSYYMGAEFQYSNGFSLYFPWSVLSYLLTKERYTKFRLAGKDSEWRTFLEGYLSATMREVQGDAQEDYFIYDLEGLRFESNKKFFLLNPSGKLKLALAKKNSNGSNGRLNMPISKLDTLINRLNMPISKLEMTISRLNMPISRLNMPISRFSDFEGRLNMPISRFSIVEGKLNMPISRLSDSTEVFNFARTKNFPWLPRFWQPAGNFLKDDLVKKG